MYGEKFYQLRAAQRQLFPPVIYYTLDDLSEFTHRNFLQKRNPCIKTIIQYTVVFLVSQHMSRLRN